jgi:hypothetical protein
MFSKSEPRYRIGNALLVLSITLIIPSFTTAETVDLFPLKDNTLYETGDGSLSNGAGQYLFAGLTSRSLLRRALLAFDVTGNIPPGSVITSVSLTMSMSRTVSGASGVSLHKVSTDWGEGASNAPLQEGQGAPSSSGDATWIHTFHDNQFWDTPGGDFSITPSAETIVDGVGFYIWGSNPQMIADVQGWLDGGSGNIGWILIGDEGVLRSSKRFDSKDHLNLSNRPMLTVEYSTDTVAAGRVFDGSDGRDRPLLLEKRTGEELTLSWGGSCVAADDDFEVYEGTIGGNFRDHVDILCSTGGLTDLAFAPSPGSTYYLIVPRNSSAEGSYGLDSDGMERSRGVTACLPQTIGSCQ